jgi:hypothetical protein
VGAGRRSGKTAIIKKKLNKRALRFRHPHGRFFYAAPTQTQVRDVYWDDLKRAFPRELLVGPPRETNLSVQLITGATIRCIGMDKPERAEGQYLDGIALDEYADMKRDVWSKHVRAGLSSKGRPPGFAYFLGVPDFRGPHFREIFRKAQDPDMTDWEAFHWLSADILDPAEIEAARADLDEISFAQEYEASFVVATGRAYYPFSAEVHAAERLTYDPKQPLRFCFDFNVEPGIAVVCQEQRFRTRQGERKDRLLVADQITAVIGEVWIPKSSNTELVCKRLIKDWGHHKGNVVCYGDATGGARGSAKLDGTDWEIIKDRLRRHFGNRVSFRVKPSNPPERVRVNALNSRLRTADRRVHLLVCPTAAPHVVEDLDLTCVVEGGSGELDKKSDLRRTHISDALGYYIEREHPSKRPSDLLKNTA